MFKTNRDNLMKQFDVLMIGIFTASLTIGEGADSGSVKDWLRSNCVMSQKMQDRSYKFSGGRARSEDPFSKAVDRTVSQMRDFKLFEDWHPTELGKEYFTRILEGMRGMTVKVVSDASKLDMTDTSVVLTEGAFEALERIASESFGIDLNLKMEYV